MTLLKALGTVVGLGAGLGAAGGAVGILLGVLAPGYYRQVFTIRDEAAFRPIELGLGLGVTQGVIWGLVLGVLIVVVMAWKEVRIAGKGGDHPIPNSAP